jgi:hypothetical protein
LALEKQNSTAAMEPALGRDPASGALEIKA